MAKRMQHCFWCGECLGEFQAGSDIVACCDPICERHAREAEEDQDIEARRRAERDNYNRYR